MRTDVNWPAFFALRKLDSSIFLSSELPDNSERVTRSNSPKGGYTTFPYPKLTNIENPLNQNLVFMRRIPSKHDNPAVEETLLRQIQLRISMVRELPHSIRNPLHLIRCQIGLHT